MGCDIHVYIERKEHGMWWRRRASVSVDRNYRLFASLAGVRNYDKIEPLYPPRGLPDDVCVGTAFEYTDDLRLPNPDWHTPSWLTLAELIEIKALCEEESWNDDMDAILAMMIVYGESRIVFWFDN